MEVDIPTAEQESPETPAPPATDKQTVEDMLGSAKDRTPPPQGVDEVGTLQAREPSQPHENGSAESPSVPKLPADVAALASLIFDTPGSGPSSPLPTQARDPSPVVSEQPKVERPNPDAVEMKVEMEPSEADAPGDDSTAMVEEPIPLSQSEEPREPTPPAQPDAPLAPPRKKVTLSQWMRRRHPGKPSPQSDAHPLPDVGPSDHPQDHPQEHPESPMAKTEALTPSVPPEAPSESKFALTGDPAKRVPSEAEKYNSQASIDHPSHSSDHRGECVIQKDYEQTLHNGEPHTSDCNGLKASSSPNHRPAESETPLETLNAIYQGDNHIAHDSVPSRHPPPHLSPSSTRSSPPSDVRETTEPTLATPSDDIHVRPASPSTHESRMKQSNTIVALRSHTTTPAPVHPPAHQSLVPQSKIGLKDGTEDGEIILSPPAPRAPPVKPQLPPHPPTQPRALSGRFGSPFTHNSPAQAPHPHPVPAHPLPRFPASSRPPPSAPRAMVGRPSSVFPAQPRALDRDRERERDRERDRDKERDRESQRDRDPPAPARDRDFWLRDRDRERDRDRDRDRNRHLWDRDRDKSRPRGMR